MKILLINIALRPDSSSKLFPVGLCSIATALKTGGYEFDLLDIDAHRYSNTEVDELISKKNYDVIASGCIVTGYKYIKDLAKRIRLIHPQAIIIAGNTVASSIPQILLKNTETDIAVIGEGERTILELLVALRQNKDLSQIAGIHYKKNGKLYRTEKRPPIKDIDEIPPIDHSIFDVELYIQNNIIIPESVEKEAIRPLPVNTARGCISNCTFCYHAFQHVPYRQHSIPYLMDVFRNMIEKYQVNFISLADELTFFNKSHVQEFSQAILDSGLKFGWAAQCRAGLFNSEDDLELIRIMKKAGCTYSTFSLESASTEILQAMNKKITVEGFSLQASLLQRGGLGVHTSLVFGYPQETKETIKKTFDVCIENNIYPSIGFLLPQPGSKMYQYGIDNGYISDEEQFILGMGDRQDLYINYSSLSDNELFDTVEKEAQRCNEALNVGLDPDSLIKTGQYRKGKNHKDEQTISQCQS